MATEDNFTFPHSSFGQQGGTKISKMMSDNALTMLPAEFEPDENDVICQRGKDSFKHEGNKRFRELIDTHISPYLEAGSRQEKSAIVGKIYDHIRKNASKPSNGFVRKDLLTRRWFLVSDKEARDKVGQALRDAIKVIRSSSRKSTPDRLVGSAAEDKNELLSSSATPQQAKRRKRSMSQQAAENPRIQYDHEQTAEKDLPGGRESSRWGISSMDFRVDGSGSAPHLMSSRFFENQSQAALGPFPLGSSSGLTGAGGKLLDDVDGLAMASSGTMLESSIEPIDGGKAGQKRQISSGFDSSISSNNNALQFASEGLHYPYHDMMDGSTIMKKSPPMSAVNAPSPSFLHQQEYFEGRAPPAMRYQQENPASELQLRMRNALGAGSTTSFLPSVGGGGSSAGTSMYFAQQQQQQQQQQQSPSSSLTNSFRSSCFHRVISLFNQQLSSSSSTTTDYPTTTDEQLLLFHLEYHGAAIATILNAMQRCNHNTRGRRRCRRHGRSGDVSPEFFHNATLALIHLAVSSSTTSGGGGGGTRFCHAIYQQGGITEIANMMETYRSVDYIQIIGIAALMVLGRSLLASDTTTTATTTATTACNSMGTNSMGVVTASGTPLPASTAPPTANAPQEVLFSPSDHHNHHQQPQLQHNLNNSKYYLDVESTILFQILEAMESHQESSRVYVVACSTLGTLFGPGSTILVDGGEMENYIYHRVLYAITYGLIVHLDDSSAQSVGNALLANMVGDDVAQEMIAEVEQNHCGGPGMIMCAAAA